jgi:acyl-CoA dehydrogenase
MYRAPLEDITRTLNHVAGLAPMLEKGLVDGLSPDLVEAIVAEAGRFAAEETSSMSLSNSSSGPRARAWASSTR